MKKILLLFIFATLVFATCIDVGIIKGASKNRVSGNVLEKEVLVYVCNNSNSKEYYIRIKGILSPAVGLSKDEKDELVNMLQKSIKWGDIAKEKKVPSFTKQLYSNYSNLMGNANNIEVDFITADKGKSNGIVINIIDFNNYLIKDKIVILLENVKRMIKLLKESDQILKKAKEIDKIAETFK